MTKDQLWRALAARNPNWETSPITMQPPTLRKLFDLIWTTAQEDARQAAPPPPATPYDAFSELFRKRPL